MKKFVYALLLIALLASPVLSGIEKRSIKFGVLTKLNTTEEEFSEAWRKTFAPNNENLEITVKFYDSLTAMQMAMNAGEINQMVLPEAAAHYLLNQNSEYETTLSLRSKSPYGLAFGFHEDNKALRDKFNEALAILGRNWRLAALEGVYIASPSRTEPEPVKFKKFNGADTIKIAITGDLPPIDFILADGTPAGFNTAVLAEVGNILHMNIELINVEAGARTAALASGRADVVFWYEVNNGAEQQSDVPDGVILSTPYYEWNNFLHVKKAWKTQDSSSNWDVNRSIWELLLSGF